MGYLDKVKALMKEADPEAKTGIDRARSRPDLADGSPQWHAEEIAKVVEREGVCVFWSELFGEIIAFMKDDSFKSRVPCGIVTYTKQELLELSKTDLSETAHRLIHEAKKTGSARIVSHEPKGSISND